MAQGREKGAATRIRAHESAERTVEVVRELMGAVEDIVFVDPEILNASLEVMGRYQDKRLSLADCSSLVVIERLGVQAHLPSIVTFATAALSAIRLSEGKIVCGSGLQEEGAEERKGKLQQ